MKKLMVALGAVALAMGLNAASVSWSATGIVDRNGTAVKDSALFPTDPEKGALYKVVCTFYDANGNFLIEKEGSFNQSFGSFSGTWKDPDDPLPSLTTTYFAQMVITDKDGYTLTSEKAEFATTSSSSRTINFGNGSNFKTVASKFDQGKDVGAGYGWAVPEPTSGLLLLLGVAGLALRRRRA